MAQFNALVNQYIAEQENLDYRAALICTIIAEVNRNPKKHKAFTPKDFMPKREARKELTGEQILERAKMITIALGGSIE